MIGSLVPIRKNGDLLDEVEGFSLADGTCLRKMGFLRWKIRGGI